MCFGGGLKKNQVLVFVDGVYDGYYGIELELTLPKGNVVNSAAVVKPLLDGIISAFHAYEAADQLTEVTERLGAVFTDATPDYISKLIIDKKLSVLGSDVCWIHTKILCNGIRQMINASSLSWFANM